MQDHQDLRNAFRCAGKINHPACKTLRVWTKNEENLRFFDQSLYGKLTFFTIFTKYFVDFCLLSESIYLWKITPDFYNNFSDFGGGGRSGVHPAPDATDYERKSG